MNNSTTAGLRRWNSSVQLHQTIHEEPDSHQAHARRPASMSTRSRPGRLALQSLPHLPHPHPVLTETEFQTLPASVQKKYFSTLERLQIAHYSANVYWQAAPPKSRPRTSATHAPRPTTSHSHGSSIRRLKKRNSLNLAQIDVKAESHFYQSLPDKIRRQHFSKEDQIRLQTNLEIGSFLDLPRSSQGSRTSSTTSSRRIERRQSLTAIARKDSKVPSVELAVPPPDAMNCFDGKPSRLNSRRSSRKLSVQANERPPSSAFSPGSTGPSLYTPTSPVFSHHRHMSSRTAIASFVRPSIDSNISLDAAATYYQDPEARMKLRQYLASPQKFDEAVAFGFPSMSASTSGHERDAFRTPHTMSGNDAQTFLKDDSMPFLDQYAPYDSELDADSISYNDSPVTPADSEDIMPRTRTMYGTSIFAGLDRTELPSLKFKFDGMPNTAKLPPRDTPVFDPLANREMTLRMTLTRPDLRATEEELYGWTNHEADPLALETLQLSDDVTGRNGAFAVKPTNRNRRSRVFKKLLQRVKSRS